MAQGVAVRRDRRRSSSPGPRGPPGQPATRGARACLIAASRGRCRDSVFDVVGRRNWFFALSALITIPGLIFILLTFLHGRRRPASSSRSTTRAARSGRSGSRTRTSRPSRSQAVIEARGLEAVVTRIGEGFIEIRTVPLGLGEPPRRRRAVASAAPSASAVGASASPSARRHRPARSPAPARRHRRARVRRQRRAPRAIASATPSPARALVRQRQPVGLAVAERRHRPPSAPRPTGQHDAAHAGRAGRAARRARGGARARSPSSAP